MMNFYTYILYSASSDVFYKGFTEDIEAIIADHNADKSRYTKGKGHGNS